MSMWSAAGSRASLFSCETEGGDGSPSSLRSPEQRLVPFRHFEVHAPDTHVGSARGGAQLLERSHAKIFEIIIRTSGHHRISKPGDPDAAA